jgi:hypothetical protein
MICCMAPALIDAIHLMPDDSAAGLVRQVGVPRKHIRILSELLTVGPCDVDPERHVALRRAWNSEESREPFGLDDLRAAVADELPVIVWATRAYADLVWLWWVLDGVGRLGLLPRPVYVARPRLDHPLSTVGGATVEEALAALADAHPLQEDELREGAKLWKQYASPVPLAFDEARRSGSLVFPELRESAELHGSWFPRFEGGHLRLAEHDERLLGCLTDRWLTTRELIFEMPGHERLLWPFGGFVPVRRLRAWAAHGAVAREARSHDSFLEQDAFRCTDRTQALLERGLEGMDDAPPFYVGGCRLYDPAAPWVRVAGESGWKLARYQWPNSST